MSSYRNRLETYLYENLLEKLISLYHNITNSEFMVGGSVNPVFLVRSWYFQHNVTRPYIAYAGYVRP